MDLVKWSVQEGCIRALVSDERTTSQHDSQQIGMLHSHSIWAMLHIQEDPYRNFGTIAIKGIRKDSETSNPPETLRASKSLQQLDSDDILPLGKVTLRFGWRGSDDGGKI